MQKTMNQTAVVEIDGSQGEGGGQILRTALALSAITQRPLSISGIRAGRQRPGLLRQHLTGVRAMTELCSASTEGAELGSTSLRFTPGPIRALDYRWAIGSAGSTSLVLQTVMFPLLAAGAPVHVAIEGGTHNGQSPSFEFLAESLAPLLARLGHRIGLSLGRVGFYPAGGGSLGATLSAERAGAITEPLVLETPTVQGMEAIAWSANIPERIGRAELAWVGEALGIPAERRQARMVDSAGPGNALSVIVETDQGKRVFTSFGAMRLPLETVAEDCVAQVRRWLASGAAVDEHLQDQLLLPLALGPGGRFTTTAPSPHSLTNMAVIRAFLPVDFACRELGKDLWEIGVSPV